VSLFGLHRIAADFIDAELAVIRVRHQSRPSVASDETFARWLALPEHDRRTIEEFCEDGGWPVGSPNRPERDALGAPLLLHAPDNLSAFRGAHLNSLATDWMPPRARTRNRGTR
jgi:hypothetical protein